MKINKLKRIIGVIVAAALMTNVNVYGASNSYGIKNPRKDVDLTTWDVVTFGNYPQAEVVKSKASYTGIETKYLKDGDLIEDENLFNQLQSISFNEVNIAKITNDGKTDTYLRMKKSDAYFYQEASGNYKWTDDDYHYFKCEPIKWRVLSVKGNEAFLLTDRVIDTRTYDDPTIWNNGLEYTIDWDGSGLRSWLNGYDANSNRSKIDYTNNSFLKTAFSKEEIESINSTNTGSKNDKVFILTIADTKNTSYGFVETHMSSKTRVAVSTVYAVANGAWWFNPYGFDLAMNTPWWLRDKSENTITEKDVCHVDSSGSVYEFEGFADQKERSVRPAIKINLSSNLWKYIGTVNSNGEEKFIEYNGTNEYLLAKGQKYLVADYKKTSGDKTYKITETKSNKKIAVLSTKGIITAKKEGKANIKLRKGGNIVDIVVNVVNPKFSKKSYSMNNGENIVLDYDSCGMDTVFSIPDKQKSKGTVSVSGNDIEKPIVTANKRGKITVYATVGEGKYSRKTATTIKIYDPKIVTSHNINSVNVGKTLKASIKYGAKNTTWSSSDTSIATVSKGRIKGISPGTAIITAINNGREMSVQIVVEE